MNKRRGKRGVSPVIATILLIGMVVAIGAIIFLWVRGFVKEEGMKGGQNIRLVCGQVEFETSYADGVLSISNTGNVPVFRFKIELYKAGSFSTKDLKEASVNSIWPSAGLKQGEVFSDSIGDTTGVTKIMVVPVLLGSSGTGQIVFTCADYGKDALQ